MPVTRSIVITGFMGSGKTSVAEALAELVRCSAIDLDTEITRQEGRTPAQLITENGDADFRKIETSVLRQVLARGAPIIALGGGAWTISKNRDLLKEFNAFSVWLDVPFGDCWKRIAATRINRPLAPDRKKAKALYDFRRPLYELAELRVEVSREMNAEELARQIVAGLPNDVIAAFR